jgi:hypothetical protein
MTLPTLRRVTSNFVNDWARSQGWPCQRHTIFAGECYTLSRRLCKELSLQRVHAQLVKGEFHWDLTDRESWGLHYWLTINDKYIVDPSIEQFINTKKYVRSITDPRYNPDVPRRIR